MEKIGILIEIKGDEIKKVNYGMITAARDGDNELYAFIMDGRGDAYKDKLQAYGVKKIISIIPESGVFEWNPEIISRAIIHAMNHFGVNTLIGLTSAQGQDLLPRIAAGLDAPLVMDCIGFNLADHIVTKYQFSGKALANIKLKGTHFILGVRPNIFDSKEAPCETEVISCRTPNYTEHIKVKEIKQGDSSKVDLTEADIIISGGRPMKSTENFDILYECADVMEAAVGASRAAVDAGYVPHSMQVGQTGVTVNPKLYIACGIQGAIQHFAGMKTSGVIAAVNTDPNAPIMKKCDYGIVGDLFEIVPMLTKKLKKILNRT